MSEERFDRMENLMQLLIGSFADFRDEMLDFKHQTNERFDRLDGGMDAFEVRMDAFEGRMDRFEVRMDRLEVAVASTKEETTERFLIVTQSLNELNSNVLYLMPTRALHGGPRHR